MRVLIVTKLFPNRVQPLAAPFNRRQFAALAALDGVAEVRIVAPIPWFPGALQAGPGAEAFRLAGVPRRDRNAGLEVHHPRFLHIPRLVWSGAGALMAASLLPHLWPLRHEFDVLLGSWAYPHGVSAVYLGDRLGLPVVVMALGSDLNSLAGEPGPRRALRAALPRARRVVCVSRALAAIARDLGVEEQRIDVVPNGVDTELFRPRDRAAARQRLGVPAHHRVVLFVGWLEESKGIFDLIEAYRRLPPSPTPTSLFLLGDGTARQRATELAAQLPGLRLLGARPPEEVSEWLAACDLLALPSWREGMPNALLEALACGRRVVASRVGGIPELIDSPVLGTLVEPRDPAALGQALASALATRYDPDQVVGQARLLSWQGSAALLRQALERARRSG